MREIVLDTETTGLDAAADRIVEIGCVELVNHMPTGRTWHRYVNPEQAMSAEAQRVHGLTDALLADKPVFASVSAEFLDFIGDAGLVIHNAAFDVAFLNAELARLGMPPLLRHRVVDTLELARQRFPGAQLNLDALCRRFAIDTTQRTLHGALLDARLLGEVYLELRGGRQPGLVLFDQAAAAGRAAAAAAARTYRPARPHAATPEELAAHAALLDRLTDPLWRA